MQYTIQNMQTETGEAENTFEICQLPCKQCVFQFIGIPELILGL